MIESRSDGLQTAHSYYNGELIDVVFEEYENENCSLEFHYEEEEEEVLLVATEVEPYL